MTNRNTYLKIQQSVSFGKKKCITTRQLPTNNLLTTY